MHSRSTPRGAIVTREASLALLEFKTLVDSTAEKIRAAEREAVGFAIGQRHGGDPLRALRVCGRSSEVPRFRSCPVASTIKDGYRRRLALGGARPARRTLLLSRSCLVAAAPSVAATE